MAQAEGRTLAAVLDDHAVRPDRDEGTARQGAPIDTQGEIDPAQAVHPGRCP